MHYDADMRSYHQYCGLARALDHVGDRWTLLIVRELLIRGVARYSDLQQGLPGIATNLLANRLRQMERSGLIVRDQTAPPVAANVFRLTPRGQELKGVIEAFGRWASPLMEAPPHRDAIRGHWFILPVRLYLRDRAPSAPPVTVQIEFPDAPIVLRTRGDGRVTADPGRVPEPDATVSGTPSLVMGLLSGRLTLRQARARGLRLEGNAAALERVQRDRGAA